MERTLSVAELDVRFFAPRERHSKIFQFFDRMAPGEKFILVNDRSPKPLLCQFANERKNQFAWFPLEEGPVIWRVEITKRNTSYPRGIQSVLGEDHIRLDQIFFQFEKAVHAGRWLDALGYFGEFKTGLERHIRMEEEILFPEIEEKAKGLEGGLDRILWEEHQSIRVILSDLGVFLATSSKDRTGLDDLSHRIEEKSKELFAYLQHHNAREEVLLYKLCDNIFSESEKEELLQKMEFV